MRHNPCLKQKIHLKYSIFSPKKVTLKLLPLKRNIATGAFGFKKKQDHRPKGFHSLSKIPSAKAPANPQKA